MEEHDTPARALTLDEAIALAIQLQKTDHLEEAQELYRQVLEVAPDHPGGLHYSGVLAHQQGRSGEAIDLIERSLALASDQADWHSNLGIVLQATGQLDRAVRAYERAIALDAGHANAHSNLGVLLRALGKPLEAEASYRAAIRLEPNHIDAYTNLGILLNASNRTEEAAACYCKVITLMPKHREARKLLALAHCTLGEIREAVAILEEWLDDEPESPIARHLMAACTGRDVPGRASDAYVESTFDSFAASFEAKLARLSYRAPALVATMIEDAGLVPERRLDILDAGCGTGLCGPLVAPYARRLTGVDLSVGMLAHAKEKHVYDELTRAELTAYLRAHPCEFDVIVSADTLVYFGNLEAVFAAAAGALRPDGLFVFTLEHAIGDADVTYRLQLHGRYTHGHEYVERMLVGSRLQPRIVEAELRTEAGAPVAGLVIRATLRRQLAGVP